MRHHAVERSQLIPYIQADEDVYIRYLDPQRPDDDYGWLRASRRVKLITFEYWHEEERGYRAAEWFNPRTEAYTFRLLGTLPVLACLDAQQEPAAISSDGQRLSEQPFQVRRAYQLQMVPRYRGYQNYRTIITVDSETFLMLSYELFKDEERIAATIPLARRLSSEPGNLYELAGSIHVPSDHPGLFVSYMPTPGSQRFNTGELSDAIFNPKSLQ
jgi:hypothetical protein